MLNLKLHFVCCFTVRLFCLFKKKKSDRKYQGKNVLLNLSRPAGRLKPGLSTHTIPIQCLLFAAKEGSVDLSRN